MSDLLVSCIIPTYNAKALLGECVSSLLQSSYANIEIIIVDNNSDDGTNLWCTKMEKKYRNIRTIRNNNNRYFAPAVNQGIAIAEGTYVLILNNDTIVEKHAIANMVLRIEQNKEIGAVHPKILIYDTTDIDTIGGLLDLLGYSFKRKKEGKDDGQIFYVGMGLYRKSLIDRIGCYDDDFTIFWEDVDLSWRIHLAGFSIVYEKEAIIYHKVSTSTQKLPLSIGNYHLRKNRIRGLMKNYNIVNLIIFLPLSVISLIFLSIFQAITTGSLTSLSNTYYAINWNINHFNKTRKERKFVQYKVRKVNDFTILKKLRIFP